MRDFLLEQCREIAARLPDDLTFDAWLEDFDPRAFDDHDAVTIGDALYAMGNLNGAGFSANRTIRELLDVWDIDPALIGGTIYLDRTGAGRPRYTHKPSEQTIVCQPFMSWSEWSEVKERFFADFPDAPVLVLGTTQPVDVEKDRPATTEEGGAQ